METSITGMQICISIVVSVLYYTLYWAFVFTSSTSFTSFLLHFFHTTKDPRGVMEMLLMMAGDVEPNPGPTS